jgi:hypothetical protein
MPRDYMIGKWQCSSEHVPKNIDPPQIKCWRENGGGGGDSANVVPGPNIGNCAIMKTPESRSPNPIAQLPLIPDSNPLT